MTDFSTRRQEQLEHDVDELLQAAASGSELPLAGPPVRREALDREEQVIKDAVLRTGNLVEDAIRRAAQALVTHDTALALDVITSDTAINDAQRTVTRQISVTIATQAPVARDLRYLLTLDHVMYELERIGDHAASVAKAVLKLAPEPPLDGYLHLPAMAEQAAVLVHGVLRALVDVDAVAARQVAVLDDEIDRLYHAHLRRGRRADARRPGERRARHAHRHRFALSGAHRRPVHEHRRGHRLSRDG